MVRSSFLEIFRMLIIKGIFIHGVTDSGRLRPSYLRLLYYAGASPHSHVSGAPTRVQLNGSNVCETWRQKTLHNRPAWKGASRNTRLFSAFIMLTPPQV